MSSPPAQTKSHSALSSDANDVWTVPEVAMNSLAFSNEHQQDSSPTASSALRTNDVKDSSCNLFDVANAEARLSARCARGAPQTDMVNRFTFKGNKCCGMYV